MAYRKKPKFTNFYVLIINCLLIISTVFLIRSVLKFNGIEDIIRYSICGIYSFLILLIVFINFKSGLKNKKFKLVFLSILSVILIVGNFFVNYNTDKVFNLLSKISNKSQTISISLVTLNTNKITSIDEINDKVTIGGISSELSNDFSNSIGEYLIKNGMKNNIKDYDNYNDIIKDLNSKKITYAFLPTQYNFLFSSDEEIDLDNIKVIDTFEKNKKLDIKIQKDLSSPFTVLLMGVDTLTTAYNADTLMVITFNPNTLNSTILSIPRDTYTEIACTGKKRKINSSGLHGDDCVIKTVEKYLDIDIDYYFKVNFKGLVNIVDILGGIEVDVPYTFCEQNSNRDWGKKTVYVEKGVHTLNGEQALALTRNRHYWPKKCSKKYTTEGVRSDFVRGQNQQLVFKSMLNKAKSIRSISTVYKLLDTLGNNMVTNMSTETILSVYNIGKDIIYKMNYQDRDISQILLIEKLKFTSTTQRVQVGSYNMDVVINSEKSLETIIDAMKKNLDINKTDDIKTIEFDINDPYEEKPVGIGLNDATKTIKTLPNFVGKTTDYVKNYAIANGITVNYKYRELESCSETLVLSQDVKANTDISNISVLNLEVCKMSKKQEAVTEEDLEKNEVTNEKSEENDIN